MAKTLTATQKKNKYRALQYSTFVGEFVSILTPFIVMGAVNAEEWFYNENGWKVGLGGTLALALMGIAVFMVSRKKEDEKITSGYVALVIGWFAVAFVFMLLASIMEQITTIMMFGGLGLLGAFGLDMTSKSFKVKADLYKKSLEKVKVDTLEEQIKEEIAQEMASKTVKVKVKKDEE